jgi:hypothetical protein
MRRRGSCLASGLLLLGALAGPASAAQAANIFTTIGITRAETKANGQIYPPTDPYSLKGEATGMPPSRSVGVPAGDKQDDVPLRMPDTSGTKPNLAGLVGQTLDLRTEDRKPYTKVHFFGMTADGGPAGGDFILRYANGDTSTVRVQWPDWCTGDDVHWAIGPLDGRHRRSGGDGAQCGIFHVPAANPRTDQPLVAVQLPASTTGSTGGDTRSYLMALTLEDSAGRFTMPDLSGEAQFPGDTTAPTTTATIAPDPPAGGWYRAAPQLTLVASDEGGSGVDQMLYSVDGGTQQFYTGPIVLTGAGAHVVTYGAIDRAGNFETFKSVTVKVDAEQPITTATVAPGAPLGGEGWYDTAVTVSLDPRDGRGSGVARTEYRLPGGAFTPYTGPFRVEAAGVQTVEYRSIDTAGNEEPPKALALRIDATAPTTGVLLNGAPPGPTYAGAVRVAFQRDDGPGSGAVATEYSVDGGNWTAYDQTGAFDIAALGEHRVEFRSRDVAGNTENFKAVAFTVVAPPVPQPAPGPVTPAAPRPRPFVAIEDLDRKNATLTALRGGRATVRIACQAVDRGAVSLKVTRTVARRLKLASTTLASRSVRCGAQGRATVTLKPSSKVRRALARSKSSVRATLALRFGAARDSQTVTFSRGKS